MEKTIKKLLSVLLSVAMLLSLVPAASLTALAAPAPEPEPTVTWDAATENIQIGEDCDQSNPYDASYTKDAITVSATSVDGHTYIDGTRFSESFMGNLSGFVFTNSVANFSKIKLVFTDLSIVSYNKFLDSEYNDDPHWSSDLDSKTVTWEGDSNSVGLYAYGVSGTLDRIEFTYEEPAPSAYAGYVPAATDDATALAAKVVKFDGYDWYMIEDNSTSATAGTVTLLAADTSFGTTQFNSSDYNNKYSTSTIKTYLDGMTETGGAFANVADAIETVTVTTDNDTDVTAKLYLLSKSEAGALPVNVLMLDSFTNADYYGEAYWLRSPNPNDSMAAAYVSCTDGTILNGSQVYRTFGVRPALQLDLSKVTFDSATNTFALPSAYADYLPAATDDAAALAAKVVKFDDKDWYLIEDNSTAADAGTVTLFAKECVGASIFGGNSTYSGSTVEGVVNNYYTNSISTDAKTAVSGNGMFLLTTDQANAIKTANVDVLKCSQATGAESILWWLGSPYDTYNAVCVYGDNGSIRYNGEYVERTLGVRPALKLDLSKVTFDGATNTFALPAHVHSLTPHAAESAGCTTAGNSAYWSCSCGMYFSDENGETEIAENSWVIPALGHNYDNVAYSSDELYHWKVCSRCDEDSPHEDHTWGSALYVWGDNNSTVTASHGCVICGKQVSETVDTTSMVTAEATCTTKELTTFTATFTKPGFTVRTKENVETGAALGHQFGYEASGDTVTATCERAACGYHTNVTITAPALTVYGGAESAAATFEGLDAFNAATGKSVAATDVKYVGRDGTVYAESATAPTGAGKYTAKITVEGATASVNYEIAKTGSSAATVTAIEWTFDGTAHALLAVTGEAAGGTMKYALGTAAAPGTFGDSIPEATDPDTYYVWYKVSGDANHNDTDAVLVTVTVAHDEALDAVIAAIDAIGPVTEVLADQKAKIDAARAGYNALTPEQQTLVTNYTTLLGAEADYKALFVFDQNTQITISGVEKYGETLTAAAIDVPAFITDAVVRWYNSDGILIGTGETYTLTAAEIGKSVRAELYSAEADDAVTSDFTGLIGKGVIKNYTLPTAAHVTYPQTLAEATLTGGDTGDIEGVWAWVTPDAQPTSAQSGSSFELTFTPTGIYADLYEGFTTRLAVVVDPAPFEPQSIEDTASGLTFDAEFAQNVEIELTDIAYSQSAYLALLRASKKDDSGMTRLVLLKTVAFTIDGEAADEAYTGAVTVTSYVGAKLAGQTVSVWFFIDGEPVNYVGTVGYDGVLVIENVAL